ncbi:RNA polymerase sigma factor [Inquilinus limosus]|uniref:RNA polymerase sigma factor n=1 Tax=Inquilinus limosus TaxID=171674 RepID=UPI003F5CDFA0
MARESYGRLVALLAARTRDVAAAEDALAEAFAAALRQWPESGVPDNPAAWLLAIARRRGIDAARRRAVETAGADRLALMAEELEAAASSPEAIPDRRLALMFAGAHPAIERGMRAPLILQTVLGLSASEIAAAFLVPPKTMGQRLVRAKTRIRDTGIPFRVPDREELPQRLDAVLEAIYAIYARGWHELDDGAPRLAEEAIWLGQLVVGLLPDEPEAKGMLALMSYAEARRLARRAEDGTFVPLEEQDVARWDRGALATAERLLREASAAGPSGRYQIEAAIQSAHVARRLGGAATWPAIVALYDHLLALTGSPVVALNRAAALAETDGPDAALAALDPLAADDRLAGYQPYWAARGALLARAGRTAEAREALTRALGLADDPAVRTYLRARIERLAEGVRRP